MNTFDFIMGYACAADEQKTLPEKHKCRECEYIFKECKKFNICYKDTKIHFETIGRRKNGK